MKRKMPTSEELLGAIRARCLDCCGNSRKAVDGCSCEDCALHPYRSAGAFTAPHVPVPQISGQMDWFNITESTVPV